CAHLVTDQGVVSLDAQRRRDLQEQVAALAARGLRVLGAATALLDGAEREEGELADRLTDLTLLGLVGLADPPRPEARDAVALCRRAGVAVKMVTGDHSATAAAIAAEIGIGGEVVTGADLDRMPPDELAQRIDGIGVFARVAPEHKVAIVRALTARGHVVAMTGDGVNDAAALRSAHIGVAMGITGSEVTKEAGDMILADDNFATIVRAVHEGRAIYDNVIKFVRFQLSTNMGAILTFLGASVAGLPAPLSAVQVL
ncbi:MAG: HAD-IC family P-type ATPase, partial [Mycobacterium leprae]